MSTHTGIVSKIVISVLYNKGIYEYRLSNQSRKFENWIRLPIKPRIVRKKGNSSTIHKVFRVRIWLIKKPPISPLIAFLGLALQFWNRINTPIHVHAILSVLIHYLSVCIYPS